MTRVTVEHDATKFRDLTGRVEVCDASGRTLGLFIPQADRSPYDEVEVPFTDEELDRFAKEPDGRSLVEILADLEKRS